jgi:hypothetical protein
MITIGALYLGLSGGVAARLALAQQGSASDSSITAFLRFLSFFLFLGVGYFDPFPRPS